MERGAGRVGSRVLRESCDTLWVLTLPIHSTTLRHADVIFDLSDNAFVWDISKAESNFRKHGVRFEKAAEVFDDPLFVLVGASRNDEARDAVIGFDASGRLLFVVHIEIEDAFIRIVSARRASSSVSKSGL